MLEFYSYMLSVRDKTFSLIHSAGKLFHQYLVDAYTKMEANRLNFIREHQKEIRADKYKGLVDFVNDNFANAVDNIGRFTILPSTFKVIQLNL